MKAKVNEEDGQLNFITTPLFKVLRQNDEYCGLDVLYWFSKASLEQLGLGNFNIHIDNYLLTRLLGLGKTSVVYLADKIKADEEDVGETNFVIKIHNGHAAAAAAVTPLDIQNELDILQTLNSTYPGSDWFPRAKLVSSFALEIKPYCPDACLLTASHIERLLSILFYAHKAGIIHRDVRPDNIRIQKEQGTSIVWLLDWGFATTKGVANTAYSGTSTYASTRLIETGWANYTPAPEDDLESLIMVAVALSWKNENSVSLAKVLLNKQHDELLKIWQKVFELQEGRVNKMLQLARGLALMATNENYNDVNVYLKLAPHLTGFLPLQAF